MSYFSSDTFEGFLDILLKLLNERVQFTEDDSAIIYELTAENPETLRQSTGTKQNYKDRILNESIH